MGVNGSDRPLDKLDVNFRAQQAAVADLPEFADNVKLVATDPFWDHEAQAVLQERVAELVKDEWDKVGSDHSYPLPGKRQDDLLDRRGFLARSACSNCTAPGAKTELRGRNSSAARHRTHPQICLLSLM